VVASSRTTLPSPRNLSGGLHEGPDGSTNIKDALGTGLDV
jgi:hypothetical protein